MDAKQWLQENRFALTGIGNIDQQLGRMLPDEEVVEAAVEVRNNSGMVDARIITMLTTRHLTTLTLRYPQPEQRGQGRILQTSAKVIPLAEIAEVSYSTAFVYDGFDWEDSGATYYVSFAKTSHFEPFQVPSTEVVRESLDHYRRVGQALYEKWLNR